VKCLNITVICVQVNYSSPLKLGLPQVRLQYIAAGTLIDAYKYIKSLHSKCPFVTRHTNVLYFLSQAYSGRCGICGSAARRWMPYCFPGFSLTCNGLFLCNSIYTFVDIIRKLKINFLVRYCASDNLVKCLHRMQ